MAFLTMEAPFGRRSSRWSAKSRTNLAPTSVQQRLASSAEWKHLNLPRLCSGRTWDRTRDLSRVNPDGRSVKSRYLASLSQKRSEFQPRLRRLPPPQLRTDLAPRTAQTRGRGSVSSPLPRSTTVRNSRLNY